MTTVAAYKARDNRPWTRIEMLLSLYEKAIEHLQQAIAAIDTPDTPTLILQRTRAATVVTAIRSGILTEYGDVPAKVDQLCEFVQLCLANGDRRHLESALKVLTKLHEGFLGVRDEANRLETIGEILPMPTTTTFEATV